jgi:hypothetical protein
VCGLLLLLLAGCSVDRRIWRERVSETTLTQPHRFHTHSPSDGQYLQDFMYTALADTAILAFDGDKGLTILFEKDGEQVHSRVYTFADGLVVTPDGALELWSRGSCGSGDSPVIGTYKQSYAKFRRKK